MKVLSIQVGMPRTVGIAGAPDPMDREWTSGIFKEMVRHPVVAGLTGLEGDGQADLKVHGGPDKAINTYPADHFPYWKDDVGIEFPHGAFGENFTTLGTTESDVCIGDIFESGTVSLQVTQPREPCWKLARRWKTKDLSARVAATGKTGWYFRVLQEGTLEAPFELTLTDRPHPQWTISRANEIIKQRKANPDLAHQLSECPALAQAWKDALRRRATSDQI